MQKALLAFPTNRAIQLKHKTFCEHILARLRTFPAENEPQTASDQDLSNIRLDIRVPEKVVKVNRDCMALDVHKNALKDGLASGAKAIYEDVAVIVKYVDEDEKTYLETVGGFTKK